MKRLLPLTLTAIATAAFPSTGTAASHSEGRILVAGPIQVHAYKLYLIATPAARHSAADLTAIFDRGPSSNLQEHYYGFDNGVSVRIAANGRSASVRADLGTYGRVRLTFSPGGNGTTLPAGCNGARVGQVSGTLLGHNGLELATHNSYLRDVRASSVPAVITTVRGGKLDCKPKQTKPARGVTLLDSTGLLPGRSVESFSVSRNAHGFISEDLLVIDSVAGKHPPAILHSIVSSGLPTSAFTNAADLSSAHARGLGTFLRGSLDFTRTVAVTADFATGTVAGSLAARFDGLGVLQPAVYANISSISR